MPKVQWDEQYSVQITELDAHHKKIFEIINDLHEALMAEDAADLGQAKKTAVHKLENYVQEHFSKEEEYMRRITYPGLEQHQREHQKFLQRLENLKAGLDIADGLRPTEIMRILMAWLHDHLLNEDQKYGQFALAK